MCIVAKRGCGKTTKAKELLGDIPSLVCSGTAHLTGEFASCAETLDEAFVESAIADAALPDRTVLVDDIHISMRGLSPLLDRLLRIPETPIVFTSQYFMRGLHDSSRGKIDQWVFGKDCIVDEFEHQSRLLQSEFNMPRDDAMDVLRSVTSKRYDMLVVDVNTKQLLRWRTHKL